MKNRTSWVRLTICTCLLVAISPARAEEKWSEAEEAQDAAVAALALAPGPLSLQSDIRQVPDMISGVGSKGASLTANVEDVNQAIAELGATVSDQEISVSLSADVLFEFDQDSLQADAEFELHRLALLIRDKASGLVKIVGHTDALGPSEYNQGLSERRANSVKTWLVVHGGLTEGVNIETAGLGETDPVAPNQNDDGSDNPEGRALNRRVEVMIETSESTH